MSSEHKKAPEGQSYCEALYEVFQDFSEEKLASVQELFRPQIEPLKKRFFGSERLSEHSSSLSSMERHLLAVHRSELGELMRDACLRLLYEHRTIGAYVIPSTPQDCKQKPLGKAAWRDRATRARALYADPEDLADPLALMDVLMSVGGQEPDLLDVAQAGLRIAPSTTLRRYCALGHIGRGNLEVAEEILKGALVRYVPAIDRTKATCWLGHIAFLRGDLAQSIEWNRQGATEREPIPTSTISWFIQAVQAGAESEVTRAAAVMADLFSGLDEVFEQSCRGLMTNRLAGTWEPTPEAHQYLRHSHSGLPSHAMRILDAIR